MIGAVYEKSKDIAAGFAENALLAMIAHYTKKKPMNFNARYSGVDDNIFITEKGELPIIQLKRDFSVKELLELLDFAKQGGKIFCLPMFAGIPQPKYVKILCASGYSSEFPPEQIKGIPNVAVGDMDFHSSLSRCFSGESEEKIYDFINCTWGNEFLVKRWDLVMDLAVALCKDHTMALVVYKNKVLEKDMQRLKPFIDSGNLTLINEFIDKDKFSKLMRQTRVGIVSSGFDARPRYLEQLLLSDVPIVLHDKIYGGHNFVRGGSGEICPAEEMAEKAVYMLNNRADYKGMRKRYLENFGVYNAARKLTEFTNKLFGFDYKVIIPKMAWCYFTPEYIEKYAQGLVNDGEFFPPDFFENK